MSKPLSFFGGFKLTFQHLARAPVTTSYPQGKRAKQPRQHGRHVLNRYEDGMEKCIGCELCAGVCPANCIYVRGLDNPPDHPISPDIPKPNQMVSSGMIAIIGMAFEMTI